MIHKVINWAVWLSLAFCVTYSVASLVFALLKRVEVNRETISFVGLVAFFTAVIARVPDRQGGVQIALLLVEFIFVGWWFLDSESPHRNRVLKQAKDRNKARHRRRNNRRP